MWKDDHEWWEIKDLEGCACGLINGTTLVLPDETEENHKLSVKMEWKPTEIPPERRPNANWDFYRDTNLLDVLHIIIFFIYSLFNNAVNTSDYISDELYNN
jgi:hypothetical protein